MREIIKERPLVGTAKLQIRILSDKNYPQIHDFPY